MTIQEFNDIINTFAQGDYGWLLMVMYVTPVAGCIYLSEIKFNKYYHYQIEKGSEWLSRKYLLASAIPVLNILVMLRGIIFKK